MTKPNNLTILASKTLNVSLKHVDLEFICPFCGEELELVAYKVDFEAWKPVSIQNAHEVSLEISYDLHLSWQCKPCDMTCTNKHLEVSK